MSAIRIAHPGRPLQLIADRDPDAELPAEVRHTLELVRGNGRPRKPRSDDPRVERRRETYRRSKARRYERLRHKKGDCVRQRGAVCPLSLPRRQPGPRPAP